MSDQVFPHAVRIITDGPAGVFGCFESRCGERKYGATASRSTVAFPGLQLSGVAIDWLSTQKPGLYGGLEVPLHQPLPAEVEAQRWD